MSSFKRKSSAKQSHQLPGTRLSPASATTTILSTGIPSLDDILGGGLPLSTSLLILASDPHSSYGLLVQKYFIAQGLASRHDVCVVAENAKDFVKGCMWTPVGITNQDDESQVQDEKIKIAWRYEQMKQFQTTIGPSTSSSKTEEFCQAFDLATQVPELEIDNAIQEGRLHLLGVDTLASNSNLRALTEIEELLKRPPSPSRSAFRICIPSLGSPDWGDLSSQHVLRFLDSLRSLLRRYPCGCASVGFPPHLSTESWGGPGWSQKLGWVSDGAISLSAFTANPSLSAMFPSYHGLVTIHTLPSPHSLVPPSDKFSALRGLASSSAGSGGSGENNLAFKCTRRRFVFETLHLDLEGGVGERRTTPATTINAVATSFLPSEENLMKSRAAVAIALEEEGERKISKANKPGKTATIVLDPAPTLSSRSSSKPKRKVAFHSDRPELYDF